MGKINYFWVVLAMFLGFGIAHADETDTISNYLQNFSTNFGNSSDLSYPYVGWRIIKDADYPVSSYGRSRYGYNNTYALGYTNMQTEGAMNLVVTPAVKDSATLYVRNAGTRSGYTPGVEFYKIAEIGGQLYVDQKINVDVPEITGSPQKVKIPVGDEATRIGIRINYAYISYFQAPTAYVQKVNQLTITNVSWNQSQAGVRNDKAYVEADGNIKVAYNVTVRNSGDYNLTSGDENYSITLYDPSDNSVVATVPITRNANAHYYLSSFVVSAKVPYSKHKTPFRLYFRENISKTEFNFSQYNNNESTPLITPISPDAKMDITRTHTDDSLFNGGTIYFPTIANKKITQIYGINQPTKTYTIHNNGGATLKISNVTIGNGFTVNIPVDSVVRGGSQTFTLENDQTVLGIKNADLKLTTNEPGNPSYTFHVTGQVVDSTAYFEQISSSYVPADMYNENLHWKTKGNVSIPEKEGNQYSFTAAKTVTGEVITGKLVTPLLNVTSTGVSFLAAPFEDDANLTVYYSTNRKDWTAASTISTADGTLPVDTAWVLRGGKQYKFSRHQVTNIPTGNYYIGFDGKNVDLDDIIVEGGKVAISHDVVVESQSIPTKGNVNREYDASIGFKNTLGTTEKTAKASLVLSNDTIAVQTDSVVGYASKKFNFKYYPKAPGTYRAYIVVDFGDNYKVSTDTFDVVIAAEDGNRTISTGDVKTVDYSAPVSTNNLYSTAEVYYSPDQLGLKKGDLIKGVTFKGATRSSGTSSLTEDFDEEVKVWLAERSVDRVFVDRDALADTTAMKLVYNGTQHITDGGTYGNWDSSLGGYVIEESADLLKITFNEPFVYQGGYLDFVFAGHTVGQYVHATIYYLSDMTDREHAISRTLGDPTNPYNTPFNLTTQPVAFLNVESSAATISGTVTDKATNNAINGAVVSYTHGGIVYSDTTAADGKYSIPVFETGYNYDILVSATGYYPVKGTAVVNASAVNDYKLDASTTLYMDKFDIPSTGRVNATLTATAVGINYTDVKQDSYTAKLYLNGKAVADGTPHNDVAVGAKQDFTFNYTPHEAGTFPAFIQFATGDGTFTSDTVQVDIEAETAEGTVQVGDSTTTSLNAPVHFNDKNTQSEAIYTAAQLGLSSGAKINRIYYKSYCGNSKNINAHIVVWLENTDDIITSSNIGTYVARDTANMTKVYDSEKSFDTKHGNTSRPYEYDSLYTFTLPQAFTYDGRNLRVVVHTYGSQYQSGFNFMADGNCENTAIYRSQDYVSTMRNKNFSNAGALPVLFVEYSSPAIYGKVRNSNDEAVEGAVVKIASGDVYYTDTTAADGSYNIKVPHSILTYVATADAEGYVTDSVYDVAFPVGDVEQDFVLKTIPTISGAVVSGTDSVANAVVTLTSGDVVLTDTTDAKGQYSIAVQRPQLTYTASIAAEGYLPATVDGIKVADEGTKKDFAIRKIPTVSGTVKSDTTVIAGASITLKSDTVVYTATTDASGAYSITVPNIDLTFTATVAAEGYLPDSVSDISVAEKDTVVNFNLRAIPTISGVVTNGTDSISGATITLKSGDVVYTATTDVHGAYSIKVPEANLTYVATATADEYEADSVANITFEKGDTVVNFVLTYTPIEVTIPASGWTSYSNVHALAIPEGVKAYTVVDMTANYAQLKEVSSIAAGEGVILQGVAGTYQFPVVQNVAAAKEEAAEVNLLVGTADGDYTVDNASVGKVLTFTDANGATGFQKAAAGDVVAQGHAYLRAKDGITVSDYLVAGTDETTGINSITTNGKLDTSKPMYDLGGARVPKSYRGVVIQNGKKFILK